MGEQTIAGEWEAVLCTDISPPLEHGITEEWSVSRPDDKDHPDDGALVIATVHGPARDPGTEANARRIAAAPELLAAAKMASWFLHAVQLDGDAKVSRRDGAQTSDALRAAIAKAEGREVPQDTLCEVCEKPTPADVLERNDGMCGLCSMDDEVQRDMDRDRGDS